MRKYSNIVSFNKNTEDSFYKCNVCQLNKKGEIWMKYKKSDKKDKKDKKDKCIHICSYLCSKKYFENKVFKLDKVINKKDFDLPRPIQYYKKTDFKILSSNEIVNLSDYEYIQYNKDLNNYMILNPERSRLQLNIQNEIDIIDDYDYLFIKNEDELLS